MVYRQRRNYVEILFYALFRGIEYYYFFSSATVPLYTYVDVIPFRLSVFWDVRSRNNPEGRTSHLHRRGSLKSSINRLCAVST